MKVFRSGLLVLLLVGITTGSVFRLWSSRDLVIRYLGWGKTYIPREPNLEEEAWFRPLVFQEVSPEERSRRAEEDGDRYFDPKRSFEPSYQRKMQEHYAVYSYLTATRRDDPNYQKVLLMLVAKGFGISEWRGVCLAIRNYHLFGKFRGRGRLSFKDLGLEGGAAGLHLPSANEQFVETCAKTLGLVDHDFFESLIAIRLPSKNREPVLGLRAPRLQMGDAFLLAEEHLPQAYLEACAKYQGVDRGAVSRSLRSEFGYFIQRCRMRASGFDVGEHRDVIERLVRAGLLQWEDLEGIELLDRWEPPSPISRFPPPEVL